MIKFLHTLHIDMSCTHYTTIASIAIYRNVSFSFILVFLIITNQA